MGATISVEAATATFAVAQATEIVTWHAHEAGLPPRPVARAEAIREDLFDAEPSA